MSVYTVVEKDELVGFLRRYALGELVDYEGISAGIENTNYFVTTTGGRYVLTLFEGLKHADLPYFLELMAFLAEHDVPSAHPLADRQGHYLQSLNGKPAALVRRLRGRSVREPSIAQCRAVGSVLGKLHNAGQSFPFHRDDERGARWWRATMDTLMPALDSEDMGLLKDEIEYQIRCQNPRLPAGVIHADLFRDNVLFEDGQLTGLIDFYYACNGNLLYDVAITVNDWCSLLDGALDEERLVALLGAYHPQRGLSDQERDAWPICLRAAALRFWMSRLHDLHFPRPGEITHTKDPDVFKRILRQRIDHGDAIRACWV